MCIKKAVEARGSQMANGISSSFYVIVGIKQQRLTKQHHPHLKVFFAARSIKSDKALRVFRCQFSVRYNKPSAVAAAAILLLSINVSGSFFFIHLARRE